ncbi:MAG TPA: alpha/beta hydrolase [Gemmatimonadaceae bacterium]
MKRTTVARSEPGAAAPDAPPWAAGVAGLATRYAEVNGARLRYVVAGSGASLVLLHTLRTQLDMFQKVIPTLATRFRVWALDHPGHGHSEAPDADYSADFFVASAARFLDRMEIEDAIIVGESIGGTIALVLAARHHPRVRGVVAVNPYDYGRGRGLRRSSALANVVFGVSEIPVVGDVMRWVHPYPVVKRIFEGGVFRPDAFPPALLRELYTAGGEPARLRAFLRLIRHWPSWERARAEYAGIDRPVLLLYGDHDWSREEEREADRRSIPGARMRVIERAGHFLALDAPEALARAIVEFAETR